MAHGAIRSGFVFSILTVFMLAVTAPAAAELPMPKMGADKMYTEPWFKAPAYDLQQDLAAAKTDGKQLIIIWEQVGCTFCQKMHKVHFRNQIMVDFITNNFYVIKLDMRGEKTITDFDGKTMSEAKLARHHGVNGTPNIEFINADGEEVFRMP